MKKDNIRYFFIKKMYRFERIVIYYMLYLSIKCGLNYINIYKCTNDM